MSAFFDCFLYSFFGRFRSVAVTGDQFDAQRRLSGSARLAFLPIILAIALTGCDAVKDKYGTKRLGDAEHLTRAPTDAATPRGPDLGRGAAGIETSRIDAQQSAQPRDALQSPEIYGGVGRTYEPLTRSPAVEIGADDSVSLNFADANIREVVDVVLGETLGLNYALDDAVTGTVVVRTSEPIPRPMALGVLENVLALNGAALVERDGVYNVIPIAKVANFPKVVVTPNRFPLRPGVGIYVIPLNSASVASVEEIVKAQVSPGNQLAVDRSRNMMIFTGPRQEAESIIDLVNVLDVDVLAGKNFGLFPIEDSRVSDITVELQAIFGDIETSPATGSVTILPIERLNAVLAIAAGPATIDQIGLWIDRLDRSDGAAGAIVRVYDVRNNPAKDLAEVLNQIFGGGPAAANRSAAAPDDAPIAPNLDPVELFSPSLDTDRTDNGATATPASIDADPIGATRSGASPSAAFTTLTPAPAPGGPRIVAYERNNAIVVIGTGEQQERVEATLRQLDTPPLQVLIEATIAEIRLTDDLRYGLQWAFESGDISADLTNNLAGVVGPSFPGFNFVLAGSQAQLVLDALSEISNVEVISSPQLMVLDNQSARLQVGDQVPIATQSATDVSDPNAPIVNSIEFFDTGVILEVTPRVNPSGLVTLGISQEVSAAVVTQSSSIDSPTIQQRSVDSTVAVQSGETVALGGLIRETAQDGTSGIPVLQDVPVFGNLFKTTSRDLDRTELLILITPTVVRGPTEAREVTEALRERLSSFRAFFNDGAELDGDAGVLPAQ